MPYTVTGSEKAWHTGDVSRYTHKAVMKDLLADTTYWYKIGSRTFQFKTLPEDPQSYRVCIFGDLGYEHGNSTDSIIPNGLAGKFDFIVHVGYKIGSRTFQFKTLPEDPQSYRVCIFGDLGYEHGNSTDSIIPNGLAGKFDFIVHV
ncbi:hypothetical protein GCK32_006685, partial [Trichostrongylus colubriformis]